MVRRLILNADDYGHCAAVNAAVEELIGAGKLRDVSVLANGECFAEAAHFLRQHPQVSAGAHLNVVEGRPVAAAAEVRLLLDAHGQFAGLRALLWRWCRHPFAVKRAVEREWRAQLERLRAAQLHLTHADSHQHLHAFPAMWDCAVRLCRAYGIPALRLPRERNYLPLRRSAACALNTSLAIATRTARPAGLLHNDHFLGFKRAGAYAIKELLADLQQLPPGLTEIALHPSVADGVPYPKLRGNRERQAVRDESLAARLNELKIELTSWDTEKK